MAKLLAAILFLTLVAVARPAAAVPQQIYTVDRNDDIGGLDCTSGDSNDCTLRSAIEKSNASVATDTINFDGAYRIDLGSQLPAITDDVIITALLPNYDVEVNANGQSVIFTLSADDVTIEGLDLNDRTQAGGTTLISIQPSADGAIIRNNLLGDYLDSTASCSGYEGGATAVKMFGTGTANVTRATIYGNTIRCLTSIALNTSGEVIIGESITGAAGTAERNVISQNGGAGIYAIGDDNVIRNNEIATSNPGIVLTGDDALIYDNDIHDNQNGVQIYGDRNDVYGNAIIGNSFEGVEILSNASSNVIGCPTLALSLDPARQNTISGNGSNGILVSGSGANLNSILCNQIGFDSVRGSNGNGGSGIKVEAGATNTIIGVLDATGNEIGGNSGHGIWINGGSDTAIKGNFIGVRRGGTAIGNTLSGIAVWGGATDTEIGTAVNSNRNTIGSNGEFGIHIDGAGSGTTIERNTIGAYPFSSSWLLRGNGFAGIGLYNVTDANIGLTSSCGDIGNCLFIAYNNNEGIIVESSSGVTIGEDTILFANTTFGLHVNNANSNLVRAGQISNNGLAGIAVGGSSQFNDVAANLNSGNGGLPVDLGNDGFDGNDAGDADSGPNGRLNYPYVTGTAGSTVSGFACANCDVLVYEATYAPHLPGGSVDYKTFTSANASGAWSIDLAPHAITVDNAAFQAIAPDGNASEISPMAGIPTAVTLTSVGLAASPPSAWWFAAALLLGSLTSIAKIRPDARLQ